MNWLAHIFLSEQDIESQLGNLLNDTCKGRPWPNADTRLRQGMLMHQRVDSFTDRHPCFLNSKSLLGKGYLKSVVVDLTYDLLLTQHWQRFCQQDRHKFLDAFYESASIAIESYPIAVKEFVVGLIRSDHLRQYQTLEELECTFKRVDKRLSERLRKKECTLDYYPLVIEAYAAIEQDFLCFFPELQAYVKSISNEEQLPHWKPVIF